MTKSKGSAAGFTWASGASLPEILMSFSSYARAASLATLAAVAATAPTASAALAAKDPARPAVPSEPARAATPIHQLGLCDAFLADSQFSFSGTCRVECTDGSCKEVRVAGCGVAASYGDAQVKAEAQARAEASSAGSVLSVSVTVTWHPGQLDPAPQSFLPTAVGLHAGNGIWSRFADADQSFGATVTVSVNGRSATKHVDRGSSATSVAGAAASAATSLGLRVQWTADTVTIYGEGIRLSTYGVAVVAGGDVR